MNYPDRYQHNAALFFMKYSSALRFICAFGVALLCGELSAAEGISLRAAPLLFADDSGVEKRERIVRTVHPGRRREAPVVVADRPWETMRAYMWGSVHYDQSTRAFQMWYLGRIPPDHRTALLYATSTDGTQWTKPSLGMHPVNGSDANNIFDVRTASSASVLVDRLDPDPTRRYKSIVHRSGGYRAAFSANGIRWTDYPRNPILDAGDTVMVSQNLNTGEYLAYYKRPATIRGFDRRAVWLARSRDFQAWGEPELVMAPDEADDEWERGPKDRTEFYVMSVFSHAAGFLGFPAVFRNTPQPQDRSINQSAATGAIDIQLAMSADGRAWRRSWPRVAMIPRGAPGTYDGGAILNVAAAPVHFGEETWVYYTAINTGHGASVPPKEISIGRADWRRHGFVSLDAGPEGGRVETKPLRLGTSKLIINADASRGHVRVGLLEADGRPIVGYGLEDSVALAANATRGAVRWKGKETVPTDRSVRVVFDMKNSRLYSLESAQ